MRKRQTHFTPIKGYIACRQKVPYSPTTEDYKEVTCQTCIGMFECQGMQVNFCLKPELCCGCFKFFLVSTRKRKNPKECNSCRGKRSTKNT